MKSISITDELSTWSHTHGNQCVHHSVSTDDEEEDEDEDEDDDDDDDDDGSSRFASTVVRLIAYGLGRGSFSQIQRSLSHAWL